MDEAERDRKIKNLNRNGRACALATIVLVVFAIGQGGLIFAIAAIFTTTATLAYAWAVSQLMDGSKN